MIIKFFKETDTLYLQFNNNPVIETKDLNKDTIIDLDEKGNLVGITIEHAYQTANISDFSFQQISKQQAL